MNKRKENRIVVVKGDNKICEFWNVEIRESVQDNGRTLKLFIKESRGEKK